MNKPEYIIHMNRKEVGICSEHRNRAIATGIIFGECIKPERRPGLKGICPLCWSEANRDRIKAVLAAGDAINQGEYHGEK